MSEVNYSEKPKWDLNEFVEGIYDQIANVNPFCFWSDSYKFSHILFETPGVDEIYSNLTPRFDKYMCEMLGAHWDRNIVVFGFQWTFMRLHAMAKKGFFDRPREEVMAEMKNILGPYINQTKYDQFESLHKLGYLPIMVKTLDEGTLVRAGTPVLTIRNTLPGFEWLPNFLETGISMDIWKQMTVATVARHYRNISNAFAFKTTGKVDVDFQNHDFSSRGQAGFESCAINGVGFLLSSCGTDNVASIWAASKFYNSQNGEKLLAGSVPASEHSVTTSGILTELERWNTNPAEKPIDLEQAEYLYAQKCLKDKFPTGIFSYVADSYDYWKFIANILPRLKDTIMARDGKFVVRGDSGDPVHVIAGYRFESVPEMSDEELHRMAVERYKDGIEVLRVNSDKYYKILAENNNVDGLMEISEHEAIGTIACLYVTFGGVVNTKGYIELDEHIGMIYGDGITPQRSKDILSRLEQNGFASTNIVFGVGSYSLNMLSRDHLGMAIKATNTIVSINGEKVDKPIYKDPKTDSSKKSLRGLITVIDNDGVIEVKDNASREEEEIGLLTPIYWDGVFMKQTDIFEIREKLWKK